MAGKIKGITIEFDGDTSKLGNKLKEVENRSKETNKSLKEIERSLKFNPGNTELVSQQQKKLKEAIENTKEKLNILREADKQAKLQLANGNLGQDAYDELQREIINTEGSLSNYTNRLKESKDEQNKLKENTQVLKDKLKETGKTTDDLSEIMGDDFVKALENGEGSSKDVQKAIDQLSDSLEEGANKTDSMGESFLEFNAVLDVFSSIKDAIGEAIGAISEAWGEIDEGLDTIVSKTGASGDALDDMNEQFNEIYSNLAVDSKSVGDAIGEVNTQFKLQGDELKNATELLLKYSEINGTDVSSSTLQAKQAIEQFGLSNSDLGIVLDSVTKAGQDTGISVDSLFDRVIQGAPTLSNLGLSFQESVVMMSQFEQSGLDSSKMLNYMTKAQGVAAKDGKTLTEVLADFSEKAKSSTDKTKLLEEANRLFGTKGGAMMLKAVQEGKLGFDDLANAATNTQGAVINTYENMQDPADQYTIAQNNIKLALADIGTTIQTVLAPAFTLFADLIRNIATWFMNLDERVKFVIVSILGIVTAVTAVITVIGLIKAAMVTLSPILLAIKGQFIAFGGAIKGLFAFVSANPIVLIIAAIVAAAILIIKNWEKVKAVTISVWSAINAFLRPIITNIKNFISNIFNSIKNTVTNILNVIKSVSSSIWNGIKNSISVTIQTIKSVISSVFNAIKNLVSSIWNGIKNTITTVWSSIKTGVSNSVNSVKSVVSSVFEGLKSTVSRIWNGIKTAITTPITAAKNTIKSIVDAIRGLFNFKFTWPHIPRPHFRLNGSLNPVRWVKEGLPSLSIDWYQNGGIFDKPSIIGVGENGSEAVVPTNKLDKFFKDSLERVGGLENETSSKISINIEKLEVRKESDIEKIALELYKLTKRNERGLSGA